MGRIKRDGFAIKMKDQKCNFSIPESVANQRIFGKIDGIIEKKAKENANDFDEKDSLINEIHMPKTSLFKPAEKESNSRTDVSENVVSMIGILRNQTSMVIQFFEKIGVPASVDQASIKNSTGNYICMILDRPVVDVPEIQSVTQISQNLVASCYIGRFGDEKIIPIPNRSEKEVARANIFRSQQQNEDLTTAALEDKSVLTKIREFIIGENEIKVNISNKQ